jgi:hypothetical protein
LIRSFFDYVNSALTEYCALSDASFTTFINARSQSVVWVQSTRSKALPYRFISLNGFPGSEEFGLDIAWSDDRKFPSASYFSVLLERGLPLDGRSVPPAPCQVPVISDLVLGSARAWFDAPTFRATAPSVDRLAQAVTESFLSDASTHRLSSLWRNAGVDGAPDIARTMAVARRVVPELFDVFDSPTPTDWQLVDYLTGIKTTDCDSALSGPCAVACFLLGEFALPMLRAENLTPAP